jgi:hypothetical protein
MFAWRLIRREIPGIKFVVIRRQRDAVLGSLARFGLVGLEAEIEARSRALDEISVQPETVSVDFEALGNPATAAYILDHIAPSKPFRLDHWADWNALNVQVKMDERFARLRQNESTIEAMKSEARAHLDVMDMGYTVSIEPFQHFWREAKPLAEAHSAEVDSDVEPRRKFKVHEAGMEAMQDAGCLRVFALRKNRELVGYLTWQISLDLESEGLVIAQQGAWYVAPGNARGAHKLFTESVSTLRLMGVKHVFPHHRTQGRGDSLGRFFKRQGAKEIQHTFSLWIGDDPCPV